MNPIHNNPMDRERNERTGKQDKKPGRDPDRRKILPGHGRHSGVQKNEQSGGPGFFRHHSQVICGNSGLPHCGCRTLQEFFPQGLPDPAREPGEAG
jgi:hypothetical protein